VHALFLSYIRTPAHNARARIEKKWVQNLVNGEIIITFAHRLSNIINLKPFFMNYKLLRLCLLSLLVMLCGNVFAQQPAVTLDFTSQESWNIPTEDGHKDLATFTDGTYSIKLYAADKYKLNKGYLLLGKADSYLEFPAFDFDVAKIEIVGTDGASTAVKQNIFVGDDAVSVETTGAKDVTNVYEIATDKQAAGTIYKIKVTSKHNTQFAKIYIYKKEASTLTTTTVQLGDKVTMGVIGDELALPSATVNAGEAAVAGATVTWSSSDEKVAAIVDGKLKLKSAGTAKITADYAGDATYKASSTSFTVTSYEAYTTISEMMENISASKQYVQFQFKDLLVTGVMGSYTYVSDGSDEFLLYGQNLGMKAGDKVTGKASGQLYTYNNLPELSTSKANVEFTVASSDNQVTPTIIAPEELGVSLNKYITIKSATFVSASGKNLTFKVGDTEFIAYNQFNLGDDVISLLEADKAYDILGFGGCFKDTKQIFPMKFAEGDNSFKGFAAIVNNQEGTLLTSAEQSQGTSINFGVTTADDGTTCRVAADDASAVATVSGQYHNDHGCTNLKVVVPGVTNVKITVGQCTYSSAEIKVTNEAGQVVASKTPSSPGCWKNDRNNVDVLYYTGDKATLTITGMSYCPFVAVAPLTEEELAQLNATYTLTYYDLDGSVIGTQEVKGQDPIGEFKYTADNVSMPVGVVFRGWFSTAEGGKKYKTDDKVEGAMSLYAVATPMEIADNKSTFAYNLADPNFDPADHECIEIADGGYYYNTHGWTFGPGQTMKLWVGGDATITIGGCAYSSGSDITIADAEGYAVGTVSGKNDSDGGLNTFEYKGAQTTLTLTFGGRDYIHSVAIANHSKAPEPADVIAHWSWQTGTPATIANVHVEGSTGTVASDVEGINLFVDATKGKLKSNGDNVQFNAGTIIQVPVISSNDVVTVVAHPYNFQEIKIGGKTFTTETTEYKASAVDAANGYVEIESTSSPYLYSITVVQKAPKQLATLDNEAVTATFVFNAGSEGQKADFGEAAGYFVTSKVTYGSNLFIKGIGAIGTGQTQFEPYEQQNEGASGTAADESNAIRFLIQPNFGLSFTPTKVSIKATRFGTDNGLLDFSWQNPDKTTVSLAVGVKPNRNNGSPNVSEYSYDITGATPGEGTCGLVVNLYHLQGVKQIGFSDIVIEGVLNGTEKEVPVLGTITINGTELTAERVFDDAYEADFELSKQVAMVSAENPVSATAKKGDLGTITYEGDATQCKVTIPMTYGETTVSYVLNVVQKPDFTLTYISPEDGKTVLTTQQVEKDSPIGHFAGDAMSNYGIPEGYAMRGWYERSDGGRKYTVDDIVTGNMNLYGYCTEIETASLSKKYTFDLTDKLFDPDIHEAFNPTGDGFYWHDSQHGYAFKTGNKIDLLVGPKATVSVTLCRYGSAGDIVITDANGKEIGKIPGKNNTDTDGEIVAFNYEGEGGTITLNLDTDGEMYIHAVKIVNTSETNYESQGQWYFVKPGNAASFIDVLEVVNGINSNRDAERAYIFLPDGTYDLRQTVKTAISGHNISIIGQSMDGTIIVTAPDKSIEGLGSADMFQNSGSNLYLQDLTLKNALDYYQAGSAGRAAVIQDSGNRTIGKNVRLLSYQDTYFSSNNSQQAYWETCDFHGTVDFICGGGDIRFQNTTISLEPRALDGSGSRTIVAPTTNTAFGYVFDGCTVVDLAGGKGTWNFGRTWQNKPVTVYLNTTLDDNARNTIISTRWIEKGMNNTDPSLFGEYGTKDVNGNDITPAANSINSFGGTFQTIITADRAKDFSYEQMFSENLTKAWDPAALATQLKAPTDAKYDNGTVSWTKLRNGSIAFALFKNGEYVGMTDGETFNITIDPAVDALTIRAANPMGGFGPAAAVAGTVNRIADVKADDDSEAIYNLGGQRVSKAGKGVYIINGKKVIK